MDLQRILETIAENFKLERIDIISIECSVSKQQSEEDLEEIGYPPFESLEDI